MILYVLNLDDSVTGHSGRLLNVLWIPLLSD